LKEGIPNLKKRVKNSPTPSEEILKKIQPKKSDPEFILGK